MILCPRSKRPDPQNKLFHVCIRVVQSSHFFDVYVICMCYFFFFHNRREKKKKKTAKAYVPYIWYHAYHRIKYVDRKKIISLHAGIMYQTTRHTRKREKKKWKKEKKKNEKTAGKKARKATGGLLLCVARIHSCFRQQQAVHNYCTTTRAGI